MARLAGKVAVITGAGSGIGRAGALLFAQEGAKVVVADCVKPSGEETVKMVKDSSGEAIFVEVDVANADSVKNLLRRVIENYGKLDILWNNAGICGKTLSVVDETEENWSLVNNVTLKGVWLGMKYAIPEMLKTAGGGSIVNTTSEAAERGIPYLTAYTVAKGGVLSLTRAAAIEWADKNIRINAVSPGTTKTPLLYGDFDDKFINSMAEGVPMKKLGEPINPAYAALFLASDEAAHTTGAVLWVDGGVLAR